MAALSAAKNKKVRAEKVIQLVDKYWQWPATWKSMFYELLDPGMEWTASYCRNVLGNKTWSPSNASFVSPFLSLYPPRYLKTQQELVDRYKEWLRDLRSSDDANLKSLLADVDKSSGSVVMNGPFERLADYQQAKMLDHLYSVACKDTPKAALSLDRTDHDGRTALHLAARNGKTEVAKALLRAKPSSDRAAYASIQDNFGYTAEDLARLSYHEGAADEIMLLSGAVGKSSAAESLRNLFSNDDAGASKVQSCQKDGIASDASCVWPSSGGWNVTARTDLIPREWLPAADQPCFADTIDASEFDWELFNNHYVRNRRPLLIRGVLPGEPESYTRDGLVEKAGNFKIEMSEVPYSGNIVSKISLASYVSQLRNRSKPSKSLGYFFMHLANDKKSKLDFAKRLPELLPKSPWNGSSDIITQFFVGGVLMGSQMHYHFSALNVLAFGSKLWLMRPPRDPMWGHEAAYKYFKRTGGGSDSLRCIQEANDMLYVPTSWTHATICLSDCIGSAYEFDEERKLARFGSYESSK
eukprot:TRINITY_DN45396_c0_g1_i1.p1 TRINITY_DN45396_c0_g1~~TRINITY_DN45396_c0_g1_i1.p1  ORF type:complete len:588 (-),score=63.60 TRINITY_DN45396_c0_g1_i1:245-1822(-)